MPKMMNDEAALNRAMTHPQWGFDYAAKSHLLWIDREATDEAVAAILKIGVAEYRVKRQQWADPVIVDQWIAAWNDGLPEPFPFRIVLVQDHEGLRVRTSPYLHVIADDGIFCGIKADHSLWPYAGLFPFRSSLKADELLGHTRAIICLDCLKAFDAVETVYGRGVSITGTKLSIQTTDRLIHDADVSAFYDSRNGRKMTWCFYCKPLMLKMIGDRILSIDVVSQEQLPLNLRVK